MNMKEEKISSEYFFEGRIMKARKDEVRLPDGTQTSREICEHVGGVGILPIDEHGNVILVRQFRYPYGEIILEIPAGKLDHGAEDAEACGKRELLEETGYKAGKIISLGKLYPSPGFLDEVVYLYAALDLEAGKAIPDEGEFVEMQKMPIKELEKRIAQDEIRDAKTIAALLRAKLKGIY